jgi:hypothetical protein
LIGTTHMSGHTICSAMLPSAAKAPIGLPLSFTRLVPSGCMPLNRSVAVHSQGSWC